MQAALDELSDRAEIVVVTGDIARPGVAERLVAAAEETGKPLRGLIHSAAVLEDEIFVGLTRESLDAIWAPKAAGALRLHEVTVGKDLDWWVGFSSIVSLLGSPGQAAYACANAWLDGLVAWRRAAGLPAIAINWGQWADVGLASSLRFSVLDPITPAEGVDALGGVLAAGFSRVGIARLRLDRAAAAFPEIHQIGFFADLVGELETDEIDEDWGGADALQGAGRRRDQPGRRGPAAPPDLGDHGLLRRRRGGHRAAADRAGAGLADGGADAQHHPGRLRRGAAGGTVAAGRLAGRPGAGSDPSARPGRRGHAPSAPTPCGIARSSVPQRVNVPHRGERWDHDRDEQYRGFDAEVAPDNAIAVIGMAGRFPGADSVSAFWRNLRNGVESIVDLSEEDLLAAGVTERALANRSYVRRAALMSGIEEFDADFFGFTPYAARMLDPQHRLFLQTTFHALEDAGYDPADLEATVGVFGTSSASGYLLHNLMSNYDPMMVIGQGASFEMVNLSLQNDKDHLATRVAHQFDLRGPALSVATACSSSLVAVHLACQSILNGECDIALAGGSSLRVPHHVGYWYEPGLDGVADRPLQAVRRPLRRHHLRQRRRRRRAQGAAGRDRRRRPHPRRHPRLGAQQRRLDEDDLRRAQRDGPGRGHRRGARGRRGRRVDHRLRRDARHRHPAG